jgi:leishmanolysin
MPELPRSRSLACAPFLLTLLLAAAGVVLAHSSSLVHGADGIHHECVHSQVRREDIPVVFGVRTQHSDLPKRHIFTMQSAFSNIRISFYFDVDGAGKCTEAGQMVNTMQYSEANCTEVDILTDVKRAYIVETLMPRAVQYIQSALNVDSVVGNLILDSFCDDLRLPDSHKMPGVPNTDFAVYVTAVPQSTRSRAVAWARSCMSDATTGRPLAGIINFIPSALGNAAILDRQVTDLDVMTAIHELFHALGYTAGYFGSYVDLNGAAKNDGVKEYYSASLDKVVTKLVFPRALREARSYFGCEDMDGIEIEDDGGPGTAGTHWEKRVYNQELVAGIVSTTRTFVASWTLAYFEDLGFYTANLGVAQNGVMTFGKSAGCDFVNLRCDAASVRDNGYCWDQDPQKKSCTPDLLAGGYCSISRTIPDVPTWQQYFAGQPNTGGNVPLADYCPTAVAYSNSICISTSTKDTQDIKGNTYSHASRCFLSNLIQSDFSLGPTSDTRCFPFSCSVTGAILVNIKGQTVRCPSSLEAGAGDTSRLVGFKGTIMCPPAATLCPPPGSATPAPTPSPPTPQPTPAPPGYTSAPAPVQHSPKVWMRLDMPSSCFDRDTCAVDLASVMPSCRLLALRLVQCYGTNCNTNLIKWLTDNGFAQQCRDPEAMATTCIEGYVGVGELCQLAQASGASAKAVGTALLLMLVAVVAGVIG